MKVKKDQKNREKESCSKKNVHHCPWLCPQATAICLGQKSANISGKVSGPAVAAVGSAQTQIWPYSSLYFFPKSTITPTAHSVRQTVRI